MTIAFLFLALFGLLLIGTPIAVSLGLSSLLTILFFSNDSLASIALKLFETMEHYTLLAIPFFVLASAFLTTGGVALRLVAFANACVGHLRGGLAMASVLACMFFAAVSGSSPATVVAIGSIVIAGMVRQGYSLDFAAGVICNAGTLGILIPPSIVMVVYAAATDQSVGRLFMAGVIPGLLAGLVLMGGIYVAARKLDLPRQPKATRAVLAAALRDSLWGLSLILVIMGGIYGGIFTPTEAAAVAAVYAFLIASFIYRDMGPLKGDAAPEHTASRGLALIGSLLLLAAICGIGSGAFSVIGGGTVIVLTLAVLIVHVVLGRREGRDPLPAMARGLWQGVAYLPVAAVHKDTRHVMVESAKTTIMLLFIIANATLFAHVLTTERIPYNITNWIIGSGFSWWTFLIIVNVLLLIAGNFMEPSAILLIMAPILFPVAVQLDIDPIHLGIIMVVNMEIGLITPPVGLNLFVTSGITGMPILRVVRAAAPWLGLLLLFLVFVTYVPIVSIGLPNLLYGPLTP
ncbi:MAG: TRAP transporter large permease [Geminicoccaceae bacterium]|nr:TRAP transporter large permease [Geminicoccaceae bacterium]